MKVFTCHKNAEVDREIGDRRGQNSLECRVQGPSRDLPSGADIMGLHVDARCDKELGDNRPQGLLPSTLDH